MKVRRKNTKKNWEILQKEKPRKMIEVVLNDRLGRKIRVKCNEEDTVGDLKLMVAAITGTRPERIRIQKWYTVYKDHITLADYEIHDGMGLELYVGLSGLWLFLFRINLFPILSLSLLFWPSLASPFSPSPNLFNLSIEPQRSRLFQNSSPPYLLGLDLTSLHTSSTTETPLMEAILASIFLLRCLQLEGLC